MVCSQYIHRTFLKCYNRCLKEGAEDFLLKPVKLSDVKRLENYMFREDHFKIEAKVTNKRKSSSDDHWDSDLI